MLRAKICFRSTGLTNWEEALRRPSALRSISSQSKRVAENMFRVTFMTQSTVGPRTFAVLAHPRHQDPVVTRSNH